MNTMSPAGREMARLRRERGLTQGELAQKLGISQRMVAAIEAGERTPSVGLAKQIGRALEMLWTAFYGDDGEKEDGESKEE